MPEETRGTRSGEQILLIDVGNTNTVFGIYCGDLEVATFRLSTAKDRTADEHAALLWPLFGQAGLDPQATAAVVISSVVPPVNSALERLSRQYFKAEPLLVEPSLDIGLPIRYDRPAEVGADRIVNALAARQVYGAPVVVVDFGTATTFDVVNPAGEYVGGIIAPGVSISAEALFARASRLYRVDIKRPPQVVGSNTAEAMQSGIFYGYVGLVDGILRRLKSEIPSLKHVIATGGQAELVADGCECITEIDPLLTIVGLKLIYEQHRTR